MENAKQKAIEVAYGIHWDKVKDFVDENGWVETGHWGSEPKLIQVSDNFQGEKEKKEDDRNPDYFLWRPKSLSGIETNNNWISIHSEDDLPKEGYEFYIFSDSGIETAVFDFEKKYFYKLQLGLAIKLKITHYQLIVKPEKPIY